MVGIKNPVCVLVLAALFGGGGLALAQTGPAPSAIAPAADPAFAAAQQWFDALPAADRHAVQDALVWTGDYQSVVNGNFGKRTMDAIDAYARRLKLPADGTLDNKARDGLVAAGAQAKAALKFAPVEDKLAGFTIGVPGKMLPKITPVPSGQRYAAADGAAVLETFMLTGTDLASQFERLKTDSPGRKVSYKLSRPDFFVVTGEASTQSFYTRMALATQNAVPVLKGFTFSYPTAQKAALERVTIAIANSFELPSASVPLMAGSPPAIAPLAIAPPALPVAKPVLAASGLAISANRVLAALPPTGCMDPMVGKAHARVVQADRASGLALLETPGNGFAGLAAGAGSGEVVILSFDDSGILSAVVGEALDQSPPRLRAALGLGHSGGVAFDRTGALAGLVVPQPRGGRAPATYGFIGGAHALAFAGPAVTSAASATKSVGEIVAAAKGAVVAVSCTP